MASCYHISMSSFFLPTLYIIHYAACWSMLHARGSIPTTINIFILSWFRTLYRLYYILLLYTMYYYYYIYIYILHCHLNIVLIFGSRPRSHRCEGASSCPWIAGQLRTLAPTCHECGNGPGGQWGAMAGDWWWTGRGGRGLGWAIFFGLVHEEILGN